MPMLHRVSIAAQLGLPQVMDDTVTGDADADSL
jgi:hypothetical protein